MPPTARFVLERLIAEGWVQVRQNGSHRIFSHPQKPERRVLLAFHRLSETLSHGTWQAVKKDRLEVKFLVIIEKTDTGYGAHVPDLPTIVLTAQTMEQIVEDAELAVDMMIEELRTSGLPIPSPTHSAVMVDAAA